MRHVLFGLLAAVALAAILVGITHPLRADAGPGKNLKVYPAETDLKDIKKDMKAISKALGVQCDFCHDLEAFESDSNKHKDIGRSMMRMVSGINQQLKKDGFKSPITCMTCHQGAEKPKK